VGGRDVDSESALGGVVRGLESRRFDGFIKIVNNFDIRMHIPAIWIFVPGIVLYFDMGIVDNLDYILRPEEVLYTTGAGIFLSGLGFALTGYINYLINEGKISFSFDFNLHF